MPANEETDRISIVTSEPTKDLRWKRRPNVIHQARNGLLVKIIVSQGAERAQALPGSCWLQMGSDALKSAREALLSSTGEMGGLVNGRGGTGKRFGVSKKIDLTLAVQATLENTTARHLTNVKRSQAELCTVVSKGGFQQQEYLA